MNILFLTENQVHPNIGGIERVTYILAKSFTKKKINVFSCYIKSVENYDSSNVFKNIEHWDKTSFSMKNIIIKNNIDFIICQRQLSLEGIIKEAITQSKKKCFLIDVLHCMPGYEITDKEYIRLLYRNSQGISRLKLGIKLISYPIYKRHLQRLSSKNMQIAWNNCDSFILLSNRLKEAFAHAYNISTNKKLTAINNPLTYSRFANQDDVLKKEKTIVIVCRLEERSKRVSIALKSWKHISIHHTDWKLIIIGEGPDESLYKKIAKNYNLKNIYFEGRKEPLKYYETASLLLVTSANEGWGMTLTEAMQKGVVPIAMDSFPSIYDIIDNEENGIIVPNNDINKFILSIEQLISNNSKRESMAYNAIKKSKNFSEDIICRKWIELFNELSQKE